METKGMCKLSIPFTFDLYFLCQFSTFCNIIYIIRKTEAMATQQAQYEENWSEDERPMSEYTSGHSSDPDSEPDFDALDTEGPLTPPSAPGNLHYEGPFGSLQAAYDWCQEWASTRGFSLRKNQIKKNDRPIRQ
jgi:hypothetical protein